MDTVTFNDPANMTVIKEVPKTHYEMNITQAGSHPRGVAAFQLRKLVESCGYTTDSSLYSASIYRHILCRPLSTFIGAFIGAVGEYELEYDLKTVDLSGKSGKLINIAEKFEQHGFDVNLKLR